MKVLVLGSGADGDMQGAERTQNAVALSEDGVHWVLLNASPDIGQQIRANPALHPAPHPRGGAHDAPIKAVVLTDSHLRNVAGLLSLRQSAGLDVHATPLVFEDLTASLPLLSVLEHYGPIRWHMLPIAGNALEADFRIAGFPSLRFRGMAVAGRTPPHVPQRGDSVGDHIALQVEDLRSGERLFYAPALAEVGEREQAWMIDASCVLVDGTFWDEYEARQAGPGAPSATELGHLPQRRFDGRPGMIDALNASTAARKILTHVNHGNPILDEGSAQRRALAEQGIEVAFDGMVIEL